MATTNVRSANLSSDTILFVRDFLKNNITDPLAPNRPTGEQFVMTSYPRRPTSYPLITVKSINIRSEKLGQASELEMIRFEVEVRVWARNEPEKYSIFDEIHYKMRRNQFADAGGFVDGELHDFGLNSAVDIDEDGEEGIKSRVCEYKFMFIAT